jgi:hypothetical protein
MPPSWHSVPDTSGNCLNMKKEYINPAIIMMDVNSEGVMVTPSLDPNAGNQTVQPADEEYDGEFGAKGASVWD